VILKNEWIGLVVRCDACGSLKKKLAGWLAWIGVTFLLRERTKGVNVYDWLISQD
jgi:hypothetical protein